MNEYIPKEGYFYIVQEREFLGTNNYKIGRTSDVEDRLRGYSKNSKLIYSIKVDDQNEVESMLIEIFKDKFIQKREYGREYFEGDINEMIQEVELYLQFKNKYGKYITHSITIMLKKIINVKSKNKKNNKNTVTENTNIENKFLENTNLENTDLENTDLENTDLENTDLENTDLENKFLENTIVENKFLENINLENTVLENTVVENTVLENTNLENTNLENTVLENTVSENINTDNVEVENINNLFDFLYECRRCNQYKTTNKTDMTRHLNKLLKCDISKINDKNLYNLSLEKKYINIDLLKNIYENNIIIYNLLEKKKQKIICKFCNKDFLLTANLKRHKCLIKNIIEEHNKKA